MFARRGLLPTPKIRLGRHDEAERPRWCNAGRLAGSTVAESTYTKADFATCGHLFGKDSQEVEDARVALRTVTERLDDGRQHVVPLLHLHGQDGQTHAELHAYGSGSGRKVLEEKEDLGPQRGKLVRRDLGGEVVGQLGRASAARGGGGRCSAPGMQRDATLPRSVIAAKSVASGSVLDCSMSMMVAHESFCTRGVSTRQSTGRRGSEANRFLEALQVVVGLGLGFILARSHSHDGGQDVRRRKRLLRTVGSHGGQACTGRGRGGGGGW